MKISFKAILLSLLISSAAIVSFTYLSCTKDKCKSTECANGGVCNGGACTCATGYQGFNCDTASRDKFLGTWIVNETGLVTNPAQYNVTISTGPTISEVVISNFYNYITTYVYGTIHLDTLFIANQQYQGKLIFGYGVITPNTTYPTDGYMAVRYEVIDSATNLVNDFGYNPIDGSKVSNWNK
jgi:hypothetical protein